MSRKERERLAVFEQVRSRSLTRRQAAQVLEVSDRQFKRLWARFVAEGHVGLVHRARGRASNRRIDAAVRVRVLTLYRASYGPRGDGRPGFGPTHFAEKLQEDHGIVVSHDTVRRWMIDEGLLGPDRTRRSRPRRRRPRSACFGELVQMDGSEHDWFESRGGSGRCCLMVMIDDATGRRLVRFFASETLAAATVMTRLWCERFGVPRAIYVDQASMYRCDRVPTTNELLEARRPTTQFGRMMNELGVRLVLAKSPQAKGRVERANATLQDRLVKELRLANVTNIEQANAWLGRSRFIERLDAKQAVAAIDPTDRHRPTMVRLDDVLVIKERRQVGRDGCVNWGGRTLQLTGKTPTRRWPRQVEVHADVSDKRQVRRIYAGNTTWTWQPLNTRPPSTPATKRRSTVGPAHPPTASMRRQIDALFAEDRARQQARPG